MVILNKVLSLLLSLRSWIGSGVDWIVSMPDPTQVLFNSSPTRSGIGIRRRSSMHLFKQIRKDATIEVWLRSKNSLN